MDLPDKYVEDYLNRHPNETIKFIQKFLEPRQDKKIKLVEQFLNELPLGSKISFNKELMVLLFDNHLSDIKNNPVKLKEFINKHGFVDKSVVRKDLIASLRKDPTALDTFMKELYEVKHEEKPEEKPPMILVLLIDESGSMASYKNDTLRGCDKFIHEQSVLEKENVTLIVEFFNVKRRNIYDGPLTRNNTLVKEKLNEYRPAHGTRLFGSIIDLSIQIKEKIKTMKVKPHVMFTILTDGDDNESGIITDATVKKMIEDSGWEFVYLKEENVRLKAKHIGVKRNDQYSYSQLQHDGATRGFALASKNVSSKRKKIYGGNMVFVNNTII